VASIAGQAQPRAEREARDTRMGLQPQALVFLKGHGSFPINEIFFLLNLQFDSVLQGSILLTEIPKFPISTV